jgi:hypothetical protein
VRFIGERDSFCLRIPTTSRRREPLAQRGHSHVAPTVLTLPLTPAFGVPTMLGSPRRSASSSALWRYTDKGD